MMRVQNRNRRFRGYEEKGGELQKGTSKEMVTQWKLSPGVHTIMTFLL